MEIPILNIGQFEQEEPLSDFYSNSIQDHIGVNSNLFHRPHSHDFFLCVIFTQGSGKHEIDFNTYSIERGSVFFLRPGQSHFWKFEEIPEGYIFFHTQAFYDLHFLDRKLFSFPFYVSNENPSFLTLPQNQISSVELLFKEIDIEYKNDLPYKKQKLASLLDLTYLNLAREYTSTVSLKGVTSPIYIKTLGMLERTIEKFFRSEKSARFYADKLNITTKHLNRITKTTLNKTTTDIITERVVLEAKRLIVHSDNTFSQIAEMLGYADYAYFSRIFKLKTGTTPSSFKKRYQ